MRDNRPPTPRRSLQMGLLLGIVVGAGSLAYGVLVSASSAAPQKRQAPLAVEASKEATSEEVHRLCAACHAYPPPDTFPRSAWRREVKQGYDFFHQDPSYRFDYPPLDAVVRYYENRAPAMLPPLPITPAAQPPESRFDRRDVSVPNLPGPPGAAHVQLARLFRKDQVDVLVCDALNKQIRVLNPNASPAVWKVSLRGFAAHAEVVDLDGDGPTTLCWPASAVYATDARVGSVVWLKQAVNGTLRQSPCLTASAA